MPPPRRLIISISAAVEVAGVFVLFMNNSFVNAIRERRVLALQYDGFSRTIEPHAYGESKDGNQLLRAYQTSGGSESGEYKGWKLFDLSKAYSITATQQTFSSARPGYARGDKAMATIYAQL